MNAPTRNAPHGRVRRCIGTALTTLVAVMLMGSASARLAHVPSSLNQFAEMGIKDNRLILVAILEVLSTLLFLFPATRSAGLLLVSTFLGGAIATHPQHSLSIASPSIVLLSITESCDNNAVAPVS